MEPTPTHDNPPRRSSAALRWAVLLGTGAIVFAIDQAAKAWVTSNLDFGETVAPVPALADFFAITRSANRGAAFSILPQAGDLFLLIALVMIIGIFFFYRQMPHGRWIERIALGLLLGGVMGNALDRIRLGYVVDFVHLQLRPFISNVSNLADHAIVLGMGILFVTQWIAGREKPQAGSKQPENAPPGKAEDNSPTASV